VAKSDNDSLKDEIAVRPGAAISCGNPCRDRCGGELDARASGQHNTSKVPARLRQTRYSPSGGKQLLNASCGRSCTHSRSAADPSLACEAVRFLERAAGVGLKNLRYRGTAGGALGLARCAMEGEPAPSSRAALAGSCPPQQDGHYAADHGNEGRRDEQGVRSPR